MTPDRIQSIRHANGLSYRSLARIVGVNESTIRKAAQGIYPISGSAALVLELIESGELPERYMMRKDKPCARCEGIEVTTKNWNDVTFCQTHMKEIFDEMRSKG